MKRFKNNTTETKQILLSLVGESPFGIIVIDFNGDIVLLNHHAISVLELNDNIDEYLDVNILEVVKENSIVKNQLTTCLTQGRIKFDLKSIKYQDKYISIKGRVILNGMLITLEDMTEIEIANRQVRERTKQLEVNNRELEQFAYISSHDLQEPLLSIIGFSNLIKKKSENVPIPDDIKKYLEIIDVSANQMSSQLKGLLDYSRIGKNRLKVTVDTNEIIEEIKISLSDQIESSGAKILIKKLPVLSVYQFDFNSLLQNIISNSIKFRQPDVKPVIEISAQKDNGFWIFSIKDNGIGMDEKYAKKIFVIFQRLHNKHKYTGNGIGLAHAKKIVNLHEGEIWFESNKKNGVTFYFTIKT